jgi:hypothetical protein
MKFTKIDVSNVLAISRADIEIETPILMVTGGNEAGKSSLADAISMAMLGVPSRVKHKKDLGQLLHDDSKKGRVTLIDGEEILGQYLLPKGEHTAAEIRGLEFLPYLLRPRSFADLDLKERRAFLFKLTKQKNSIEKTAEMMLERGCRPDLVEEIKPMLRSGFPEASKSAAENATAAKQQFKGLTGDNWGSQQSEGWEVHIPEAPEMPDVSKEAVDAEVTEFTKVNRWIETGIAHVAKLKADIELAKTFGARKAELETAAGLLGRAQNKLQADRDTLEELENAFKVTQSQLSEAQAGSVPVKCPCCEAELTIKGQTLEKFAGIKANTKVNSDLALSLTNARSAIDMMKRTIENDIAAVTTATNAGNDLDAHIKAGTPIVKDGAIESAEEKLVEYREWCAKQRIKVEAMKQRQELLATAEETNKKAAQHHRDVLDWLKVSEALAPNGIPGEILAAAIKPVNDSLAILSRLAGWKKVVIGEDMEMTAAGRVYGLMSESAQWRIDTLIACAFAQISGLKFVLVDRWDVLDVVGRGQCVALLRELCAMGGLDQAIICGTLKTKPKDSDTITVKWFENGQVQEG